jgi:predicted nucleotidyltransferase
MVLEAEDVVVPPHDAASVEGVYEAVRVLASLNDDAAKRLFERYTPSLDELWASPAVDVRKQLVRTYRRLHSLGVVDKAPLAEHTVTVANLEGPFSANLEYLQADVERLTSITERIANDETLGQFVYPVALIGGSRLKGYGEEESDVDVSVFIKPGTPVRLKPQLETALQSAFAGYEPIAFWLTKTEEGLAVHDFTEPDVHTADSAWTHSLFGSAWVGDSAAVQQLQSELLPSYFAGSAQQRQRYLERLEQDTLQYRLLHKGYARHRALAVPSDREVFWDEGYRRLATKLYVSQVWLPKL